MKTKSKTNSTKENSKNIERIMWKEENLKPRNIYADIEHKIEPVKVIYKYKNINRKNQYITYIFLGPQGKKYDKILSKIEKLNIYDALLELTKEEELKLIDGFGDLWITKFYNIQHISSFVNKLEEKPGLKKKLLEKYDNMWISKFIEKFNKEIIFKKVNYSFGELVKFQYKTKMGKKMEQSIIEKDDMEEINLETQTKNKNLLDDFIFGQMGGNDNEISPNISNSDDIDDIDDIDDENIEMTEDIYTEDAEEIENTEEISYDDIEKIYQEDEFDKNLKTTNTMLTNILDNNKLIEKKDNYIVKFDTEQDNDIDDENLANVYIKKYIYTQYILKDDTIKNIKNKICASIKGNERISNNLYLIPSRIYLWSEYIYNSRLEKIMIGQKWLRKNELFKIDVEPLEISNYDNLSENVKKIKDTLTRYAGKIRREDDDNNILNDYETYMLNNTIYMSDIYNDLGEDYKCNAEQLKNITDIYFKLYYPKIKVDEIQNIILLLDKSNKTVEEMKIKNTFETIYNDLVMENEIVDLIESIKLQKNKKYLEIFSNGNFITQADIHVNLEIYDELLERENIENFKRLDKMKGEFGNITLAKIDLFRVFNDFEPTQKIPFIQYQILNGPIIFKYHDEYMVKFSKSSENTEMMTKWFENSPYGISFKLKLTDAIDTENSLDKFMAVNINEIGKIEYRAQWKETEMANINDVTNTYEHIKELVQNINELLVTHPRKVSLRVPENYEFRYAFINCLQKFKLPDNKIINHNDFSDFCVYFYPYISLQVEPKKRMGKDSTENKSKYGSYLRFKRVSKFDNQAKIEQRILTYLRNFDYDDDILGDEIAKQFNITKDLAKEEIVKVKNKFPNLNKTRKGILRKTTDIGKFKSPGINIDIQGRLPEKYKIRISGAREQSQLERIIVFLNILMYLYAETYINKNSEYQEIKNKLKKITNVAKRRGKVDEVVNYEKEVKVIKQMSQLDKKRLGFKPEEGQSQYSRLCQNSGKDKKRRPIQTIMNNISQLTARGYVLNKKTGEYEKKVKLKGKNNNTEIILKALKVSNIDDLGQQNEILYSCDPEENGEHMYVGFLTRSNNPFGECMPCCFKKNKFETQKKETLDFYKQCLVGKTTTEQISSNATGDILYILQDTNKIQEGRISYLPKFIDLIINVHFNNVKQTKNNYLTKTPSYFFKYGINQDNYSFIKTLSVILEVSIDDIKRIIIDFLRKDIDEINYIALNDGNIRNEYRIDDFVRYIMDTEYLDYYYLKDLIKIPGLFTKRGIFPIVFSKTITIIKKGIEKEKIKDDFYILTDDSMVTDYNYYLDMFETHDILLLIKDTKYYYPIIEIRKNDESTKKIDIIKFVDNNNYNLISIIKNFFSKSILDLKNNIINYNLSAKETFAIVNNFKDYKIKCQVVDSRFKCKYLITEDKIIIPVLSSGIVHNIPIICLNTKENTGKKDCFSELKLLDIETVQKHLDKIYKLSEKKINIKPVGLFYDNIDDNTVSVVGIMTSNNDLVPIKKTQFTINELNKKKISYMGRPLYHELDIKLANYSRNNIGYIDKRIKTVNKRKYLDEAYQLFRFELSNLLSDKNLETAKNKLKKLIETKNVKDVYEFILSLCQNQENKNIKNELVSIIKDLPNLDYYKLNNQRYICSTLDKNTCEINPHCQIIENTSITKANRINNENVCSFVLPEKYFISFVKKISVEICEQENKAYELLKDKKYYVSDIVDHNNFTEKPGQTIIKSSSSSLQKTLFELCGESKVPKIGKRYIPKKYEIDIQTLQLENPLKDIKDAYLQTIIPYNYSILRAYVNCYYWYKHTLYTFDVRNLGYYSDIQNELINLFRSLIIDWLNISENIEFLISLDNDTKEILNNPITDVNLDLNYLLIVNKYIIKLMENNIEDNFGFMELFILQNIHNIPIIIIVNGNPKYIFDKKQVKQINKGDKYLNSSNICISLDINDNSKYPLLTESIYYK